MRSRWGRMGLLTATGGVVLALTIAASPARRAGGEPVVLAKMTPQEVFERRIMPIFNSPNPSSCTQCHLGGAELKNYIRPSHEETFVSLRDEGLIDLERPADSRILRMIQMAPTDDTGREGPARIQADVRRAEYEAFAEWIRVSSLDPNLRAAPRIDPTALAQAKVADDKGMAGIEKAFKDSVWAEKNRCANCHEAGGKNTAKNAAEYGDRVLWIKKGPKETLDYLVKAKLLDSTRPERSLLLLKAMNVVKHVGGEKIKPGDACHKTYLTFLKEFGTARADAGKPDPPPDKPKPPDKKPGERKAIELDVEGLKDINDNVKLRAALSAVAGVKLVVVDRKATGPSKVRVVYEDQEPDLKALIEAASKSGYKAAKTGS